MATDTTTKKKTAAVPKADEAIENAESTTVEAVAPAAAPNDGYEEIMIPKGAADDEPNLFVGVNGGNYVLPKGKKHRVPAYVAAEIRRSEKAQEIRDDNMAAMLEASKQ